MKYLVVVAHPDDEVLGAGATIYKLAQNGHSVYVCILSGEAKARNNLPKTNELQTDLENAMKVLGVKRVIKGNFPNIELNTISHLKLVQFIEKAIIDTNAEIVFTHHPADLNNDHLHTSLACQAAVRLFQRRNDVLPLKELLFMEVPSATEWGLNKAMNQFSPNTFIEVGQSCIDKKIEALSQYRGVMREYPHPRSKVAIKGLAAYRGSQAGMFYAEAFESVFRRESISSNGLLFLKDKKKQKILKRYFDIWFSFLLLLYSSPLMLLTMLLIKINSPKGPVIFKQVRTGYKCKLFTIYKLRTMTNERDNNGELLPAEKRLKTWGKIIRKTNIDEIPQVINIIKGEMSLIGPRPVLPSDIKKLNKDQLHRQDILPGITGWEAVNEGKTLTWENKLKYDIYYIDNYSLLLDIYIFFRTIYIIFLGKRPREKYRLEGFGRNDVVQQDT